jgi:hypothetical protein
MAPGMPEAPVLLLSQGGGPDFPPVGGIEGGRFLRMHR